MGAYYHYRSEKCEWHQTHETVSERNMVQRYLQHCCVVSVRRRIGLHRCLKLHTTLQQPIRAPFMAALEAKNSDRENNLFFPWTWGCHPHPHSPSEMVEIAALRARWIVGSERHWLLDLGGWKQGDKDSSRKGSRGRFRGLMSLENFADVHYRAAVTILLLNSQYSVCKEDGLCPRPLLLHCLCFSNPAA